MFLQYWQLAHFCLSKEIPPRQLKWSGDRHIKIRDSHRRMNTVGMFEKFINFFIAMYPLHVNVIYKSEPWKMLVKWREE